MDGASAITRLIFGDRQDQDKFGRATARIKRDVVVENWWPKLLADGCLIVLGAMAADKVAKASAAQTTDEKPVAGATVGTDLAQEPLIKADRFVVHLSA